MVPSASTSKLPQRCKGKEKYLSKNETKEKEEIVDLNENDVKLNIET